MSSSVIIPPHLLKHPVHLLSLGFGSGLSPKAPGTLGTLVAAILLWCVSLLNISIPWYAFFMFCVLAFLFGIYLCDKTTETLGVHDHGGIVWDEFVGYWLTMVALPWTPVWLIAGFVLFRIFDIWKPWPIKWADHKVAGGFGIMLDDVIAAGYAWVILQIVYYFCK